MTTLLDPIPSTRRARPARRSSGVLLFPAAVLVGAATGVATSVLQQYLPGAWAALANAASPWLAVAFAAGAVLGSRRPSWWAAPLAGLLACAGEVAGYYIATPLRGHPVSGSEIALWSVCGLLGGPLLGWAGAAWWTGTGRVRGMGGALLPATFAGEAIGAYLLRLHYTGQAALFGALALVALLVMLGPIGRPRPLRAVAGWLVVAGAAATVVYGPGLDLLSRLAFGA